MRNASAIDLSQFAGTQCGAARRWRERGSGTLWRAARRAAARRAAERRASVSRDAPRALVAARCDCRPRASAARRNAREARRRRSPRRRSRSTSRTRAALAASSSRRSCRAVAMPSARARAATSSSTASTRAAGTARSGSTKAPGGSPTPDRPTAFASSRRNGVIARVPAGTHEASRHAGDRAARPATWLVLAAHTEGEPRQYPRLSLRPIDAADARTKPRHAASPPTPVTPIARAAPARGRVDHHRPHGVGRSHRRHCRRARCRFASAARAIRRSSSTGRTPTSPDAISKSSRSTSRGRRSSFTATTASPSMERRTGRAPNSMEARRDALARRRRRAGVVVHADAVARRMITDRRYASRKRIAMNVARRRRSPIAAARKTPAATHRLRARGACSRRAGRARYGGRVFARRFHAVNEDWHSALDGPLPLFVVADGVSSGAMASCASSELVWRLHEALERGRIDADAMRSAVLDADREVRPQHREPHRRARRRDGGAVRGDDASLSRWLVAWVGDCRVYRVSADAGRRRSCSRKTTRTGT